MKLTNDHYWTMWRISRGKDWFDMWELHCRDELWDAGLVECVQSDCGNPEADHWQTTEAGDELLEPWMALQKLRGRLA